MPRREPIGPYSLADLDRLESALLGLWAEMLRPEPNLDEHAPAVSAVWEFISAPVGMVIALSSTARATAVLLPPPVPGVVATAVVTESDGRVLTGAELENTTEVWVGRLVSAALVDDKTTATQLAQIVVNRGAEFAFRVFLALLAGYRRIAQSADPVADGIVGACTCPGCESNR